MKEEFFNGYVKIPKKLLELVFKKKIDCYDIAIYTAIFAHQNNKTKKCYPSNRRIAKLLNISLCRVKKSIKNLSKCGAQQHTYEKGRSSHYESGLSDDISVSPDDISVLSDDTGCVATRPQTIINNKINNKINNNEKIFGFNDYKKKYNPTDKLLSTANIKKTPKQQKHTKKVIAELKKTMIKKGIIIE